MMLEQHHIFLLPLSVRMWMVALVLPVLTQGQYQGVTHQSMSLSVCVEDTDQYQLQELCSCEAKV